MSKPDQSILIKTCSHCGQQKPLNAFLEITGTEGARYSNICADCKKAGVKDKKEKTETEDGTISTTSRTIDTKARIASEKDKREQHELIHKDYYDEREEEIEKQEDKEDKARLLTDAEKKHQEKKQASGNHFLDRKHIQTAPNKKFEKTTTLQNHQVDADSKNMASKEEATQQEEDAKKTDLTSTFAPSQTGAVLKQTGRFLAFADSLTGAAAIKSAIGNNAANKAKAINANKDAAAKSPSEKTWGHFKGTANLNTNRPAGKSDSIAEKIEQTFGPGKKR